MDNNQPIINIYIENLHIQKQSKQTQNQNYSDDNICLVTEYIGVQWTEIYHGLNHRLVHIKTLPDRNIEVQYISYNLIKVRKQNGESETLQLRITK